MKRTFVVREHFECERLQRITGEDRHCFAERNVASRASAAQAVVVHRGQVVVHQRIRVDDFDRGGCCVKVFERRAERFGG